MSFFSTGKIEKEVKGLIQQHIDLVDQCLMDLNKMLVSACAKKGECPEFTIRIHNNETAADKLRRTILQKIEKGAFLPNLRGELLKLIEIIDDVANRSETVGDYYVLYQPEFTDEQAKTLVEIGKMTKVAFDLLKEAYGSLFKNFNKTVEKCAEIELIEEQIDTIEWRIRKDIFKGEDLAMNILKKDYVLLLCDISDKIEDASDMLEIMVVRRKA